MKLYSAPGSCSTATQIALKEADADYELVKLDLRGDRKTPDGRHLSELNPKGYVPVLELDNGELLTENIAILQYVADQYPDAGLTPEAGTLERTRMLEWLAYTGTEVHKPFGPLFYPDATSDARKSAIDTLNRRFGYIDEHLAQNNYLLGDKYSVADIYLYIVSTWAPYVDYDLSPNENLVAWQRRVADRPAVNDVMSSLKS